MEGAEYTGAVTGGIDAALESDTCFQVNSQDFNIRDNIGEKVHTRVTPTLKAG